MIRRLLHAAKTEIGAAIAVGVVGAGLLIFAQIADEALEGDTRSFDEYILLSLREPGDLANPIGPPWVENAIADITSLGGYAVLMLIVTAVASYMTAVKNTRSALLLVGAVVSGAILSETLKLGFARPRPDLVAHMAHATSSSFPSGHAMLSAVVYLTLGAVLVRLHKDRRVKTLIMTFAILITVLIGASRVYLGVHWPTDVLAGWTMGAVWAALWWLITWRLQRAPDKSGLPTS